MQPVLFYKLPNDVAPGAGRRTHREVWRPLSHAFALTRNSVTVHARSQTQKSKRSLMRASRKDKAAEAQPEAQIEWEEIHVPADEMIEILPGSLRFSCLFFSTNSLPSRSTPYMTSSARVFWKAKAEPHKAYCAVVHANNLLFQRAKGVGGIVTGFCNEDQGTDADMLTWLHVVDIAKKAKQPKKAKQTQKKKKKIASKTVALLKVGDLVEVTKPGHRAGRHGRIVDTSGGVNGPTWFKVRFDEKEDGDAKFRMSELALVVVDDDDDEEEEEEDDDDEEEEEDDEVLVASFEVVGREHSILSGDRTSCITHIGLATQEQRSALESGYYMHSGDKGGRIQWQPSRLGKLPADLETFREPARDDGGLNYISDERVAEWDSLVSHLQEMVLRPKDETRKELMEDYMRKMNVLVVDNHRKGTKGTEQERLKMRMAYKALGKVLAYHVQPATEAGSSNAGKSLVVWTEDEHMVQLRKALQEAPEECLLDVPISLHNVLFKLEDDESNKRKGSSDLPPAADQKKRRTVVEPTGRRKAAKGSSSSTKDQQVHLAPATRALADQLEVLRRELEEERKKTAAEVVKVAAQQQQIQSLESDLRNGQRRYELDQLAWMVPFAANVSLVTSAQQLLRRLQREGHVSKEDADAFVPEPAPFDLNSRPFNSGSASAQKFEHAFAYARRIVVQTAGRGFGRSY